MKAKRLRALLVAGLLSLAPAVTLTSCSGGGGGGGGTAVNKAGLPLSLQGRVVTAELANKGSFRISFTEKAKARVDFISNVDSSNSWSADAEYTWAPGENAEQHEALVNNLRDSSDGTYFLEKFRVNFSAYKGKLSLDKVSIWAVVDPNQGAQWLEFRDSQLR